MTATTIPFSVRRTSGALAENCEGIAAAHVTLIAAMHEGSAIKMQMAAEEISDMASRTRVLAAMVERQIARHRRGE